ncbi:TonB-dependent receptor [Niastella vici]|uniref:TonB-dependent receptor n=1 Tax=Niastella vici TaxID=1703345 RepID=A0A1V9FW27_9BACT|nr:TonB-dependent receptor [Niastella vici]OQP62552.1 TonB-dependent receptor [Niastella vici]
MVRLLILFGFLTVININSFANEAEGGIIQGKVTTSDGQPAADVSVYLKDTHKGAVTNESGEFRIKNLPDGTYELQVSLVGYETVSKTVEVNNSKTVTVNIEINAASIKLEEIVITAGGNRFAKKESDDVSKLSLKNIENPQVYSVVGKELMKEQVITDYVSAFKNIPGAGIPIVYNQGRTTAISRGFTTANLVRNGVGGFIYTSIDPANLERIEVIKGPSATLFGSTLSSFGGLFNRVTKKPFDSFRGEISYSGASWDLNRLTLDVNTPLNKDKTALFRFNGAVHSERSFQDAGFTKNFLLAPSFSYQVNERLTLLLDVEMSGYKATSPTRLTPNTKGNIHSVEELAMPYKLSFANNTINYTSQQLNVFGQIKYKLSETWTSQTVFSRTRSSSDGYTVQLTMPTDSTLRQQVTSQEYPYYGTDIQQNVKGDFYVGPVRNRVVIGADFYALRSSRNDATINMPVLNYKKPGAAYNNFTVEKVSPLFSTATFVNYTRVRDNTYSAYVSDVINVTDQLLAMASLRVDHYKAMGEYWPSQDSVAGAYDQTALSPKFGLVYQVVKNQVSVFANYMNGFENVSGADAYGNTFRPQQANQWEAGIKLDALNNKLNATLSYYDISVTNMLRVDTDNPNFNLQDGTQKSKGFEAEVIANPIPGLNIIGGYSYNDSKYEKAAKNIQGLRPASAGPGKLANLWVSYRFVKGKATGLGLAFGGNYGSESFQTNTDTYAFTIPSYTVLDASLFYDKPVYRIGLKVDNLTNEKYWSNRLAAQNPTRVTVNLTFKFN